MATLKEVTILLILWPQKKKRHWHHSRWYVRPLNQACPCHITIRPLPYMCILHLSEDMRNQRSKRTQDSRGSHHEHANAQFNASISPALGTRTTLKKDRLSVGNWKWTGVLHVNITRYVDPSIQPDFHPMMFCCSLIMLHYFAFP